MLSANINCSSNIMLSTSDITTSWWLCCLIFRSLYSHTALPSVALSVCVYIIKCGIPARACLCVCVCGSHVSSGNRGRSFKFVSFRLNMECTVLYQIKPNLSTNRGLLPPLCPKCHAYRVAGERVDQRVQHRKSRWQQSDR